MGRPEKGPADALYLGQRDEAGIDPVQVDDVGIEGRQPRQQVARQPIHRELSESGAHPFGRCMVDQWSDPSDELGNATGAALDRRVGAGANLHEHA